MEETIITSNYINPYNSLNREITLNDVQCILKKYGVSYEIFNFNLYKRAFIHSSYTKKEQEDPYESYITQKVKCAQLMFTYDQHRKKMAEVKNIIIKTKENLKELDEQYPEFKDKYFEKYMEARRQAGLKDDENSQDNFIRFMVEDLEL